MPTSIGYQDIAALIARERGTVTRWHLIASPVEAATFSYSRPIGSAIPEPLGFQRVNLDPRSLDAYSWKIDEPLHARPARQIEYPTVERSRKSDRLPANVIAPPSAAAPPADAPGAAPQRAAPPRAAPPRAAPQRAAPPLAAPPLAAPSVPPAPAAAVNAAPALSQIDGGYDEAFDEALAFGPITAAAAANPAAIVADPARERGSIASARADDEFILADKPPEIPPPGEAEEGSPSLGGTSFLDADASDHANAIYFGNSALGSPSRLQGWAPGAEPILVPRAAELAAQAVDSNIKLSALEGNDADTGAGESVAGKDDASRLQTPAQRLGLEGKARAKAEKCLADAVYFEARGEVRKGQEAVAQVVMNRAFSGYYPHDVCGVVYQNAHRHLACQFTFACEGKDLSRIDEPDMWEQAKSIAKDTLDGKIWLAEVGHATHYHAYWVHPSWVHEMTRLFKLGVHTFYRPRNWGDGEAGPVWGKTSPASPASPSASNSDTTKPEAAKSDPAKSDAKAPQAAAPSAGART
jgi:spore germination cell wall hydrolase CwlJ-like protein